MARSGRVRALRNIRAPAAAPRLQPWTQWSCTASGLRYVTPGLPTRQSPRRGRHACGISEPITCYERTRAAERVRSSRTSCALGRIIAVPIKGTITSSLLTTLGPGDVNTVPNIWRAPQATIIIVPVFAIVIVIVILLLICVLVVWRLLFLL